MAESKEKKVSVEVRASKLSSLADLGIIDGQDIEKLDPGRVAWGGIGGSGKHAAELLPEVIEAAKNPESFRQLVVEVEKITSDPELSKLIDPGRVAWGGIGGSGKHAAELLPEVIR